MEQKKLKAYREKLVLKKQEILEAYNKNKTYGKEADEEGAQDIADKASNSYTKEFLFSLSNTERDMLAARGRGPGPHRRPPLRRLRGVRGRDGQEAPGGGALGQALHLVPGEAGAGPAVSRLAASPAALAPRPAPGRVGAPGGSWTRCWRGLSLLLSRLRGAARPPHAQGPLCQACWRALPRHGSPAARCGLPLGPRRPGRLRPLPARPEPVRAAPAWDPTRAPARGAPRAEVPRPAARGRRAWPSAPRPLPDVRASWPRGAVLVPVPLHPRRRRERGFNQSELLAARPGASGPGCAWPRARWCAGETRRPRPGSPPPARRANVAGAFAVRGARGWPGGRSCWWTTCSPPAPPPAPVRARCARPARPRSGWSPWPGLSSCHC